MLPEKKMTNTSTFFFLWFCNAKQLVFTTNSIQTRSFVFSFFCFKKKTHNKCNVVQPYNNVIWDQAYV